MRVIPQGTAGMCRLTTYAPGRQEPVAACSGGYGSGVGLAVRSGRQHGVGRSDPRRDQAALSRGHARGAQARPPGRAAHRGVQQDGLGAPAAPPPDRLREAPPARRPGAAPGAQEVAGHPGGRQVQGPDPADVRHPARRRVAGGSHRGARPEGAARSRDGHRRRPDHAAAPGDHRPEDRAGGRAGARREGARAAGAQAQADPPRAAPPAPADGAAGQPDRGRRGGVDDRPVEACAAGRQVDRRRQPRAQGRQGHRAARPGRARRAPPDRRPVQVGRRVAGDPDSTAPA